MGADNGEPGRAVTEPDHVSEPELVAAPDHVSEPEHGEAAGVADDPKLVAARMQAVNARAVVLAGTAAFALAFLVLLPFWSWLGDHDHRVWLWTSLTGALMGLLSLPLVDRHKRQGRQG